MADAKSYIVQYDIQVNTGTAATSLETFAKNINSYLGPLQNMAKEMQRAASAAKTLQQNAKISFEPVVNVDRFNKQLLKIEGDVIKAAGRMHAAMYNALTGQPKTKETIQKAAAARFGKMNLQQLEEEKKGLNKLIKEFQGKHDAAMAKGLTAMANKHATVVSGAKERLNAVNKEIEAQKLNNALITKTSKSQENLNKQQEKAIKQSKKPIASSTFPSVKQIQAYEKAFGGKSKTITFTIKENPKNAATVKAIKEKLASIPKVDLPVHLKILSDTVNEQLAAIQSKLQNKPIKVPVQLANASKLKNQIAGLAGQKGNTSIANQGVGKGTVGTSLQKQPLPSNSPQGLWRPAPLFTKEDQAERNRLIGQGKRLSNDERTRLKELNKKYIDSRVGRVLNEKDYAAAQRYYRTIDKYAGQSNISKQAQNALNKANQGIAGLKSNVSPGSTAPLLPAKLPLHPSQIIQQQQAQLAALNNKTATIRLMLDDSPARSKLAQFIWKVRSMTATMKLGATTSGVPPLTSIPNGSTQASIISSTRTTNASGSSQGAGYGRGTTGHLSLSRKYPGYHYWTEQRASELMSMRKDARAAFASLTPYEKQLAKQQEAQKQAAKAAFNTKQKSNLSRLQTLRNNAVAPYVTNASQMKLAAANLPYFNKALQTMGLTPSTELWGNSAFLKEVQRQMIAGNVKVPSYLPSAIAQAERAEARQASANSSVRRSFGGYYGGNRQTLYDRSRKWAYPFTGNTSFGARTPMAVDMAKGMGVMFAIGGAMSAISNSFGQAMEYQNTMETAKAILQNGTDTFSQSGFEQMSRTVRNVGIKTKFSAPEVASAARFLAMAGYDINSINNAIRPIADLALISDSDLGETADKMTNIMTTFGVDAKKMEQDPNIMRKYGNIMAAVATRSNTDIMMLAESAKYGGGVAHMYGREDPNNFADTMALFGIMGNAGIQGSSAGTALRMMYQNLFNPNKKQQGTLKLLQDTYGVEVRNSDGSKRSMSDIILDMANKIPAKEQADIISKLFRITAQPGANAAINAAAQAEGSNADEVKSALESVDKVIEKGGLGALAKLMLAARDAVNGDALGTMAEAKQNTIQGLWAQVTSTFTEGIVKAFEERKGGLNEMLIKLRDYFAKPETVTMIRNLLDMIIEIGKVMAWFVSIWAKLYNFAPGVIKAWVVTQMAFTQIGTLIAPVISLIGILNRFGITLGNLSVAGTAATASLGRTSTAYLMQSGSYASAAGAPLLVGRNRWGVGRYVTGGTAARARRAKPFNAEASRLSVTDALFAGSLLLPMGQKTSTAHYSPLVNNNERRALVQNKAIPLDHYAAVRKRAESIYGWGKVSRGFKTGFNATLTMASFSSLFGGLKSMLVGLFAGIAKVFGFILNPITLAVIGLTALGTSLYRIYQLGNGMTDSQIAYSDSMKEAIEKSKAIQDEGILAHQKYVESLGVMVEASKNASDEFDKIVSLYDETLEKIKEKYGPLLKNPDKGSSQQANELLAQTLEDEFLNTPASAAFSSEQLAWIENGGLRNWEGEKYKFKGDLDNEPPVLRHLYKFYNSAVDALYRRKNQYATQLAGIPAKLMASGAMDKRVAEFLETIDKKRSEFATHQDWVDFATKEAEKLANINGTNLVATGVTKDEFEAGLANEPDFKEYRQGMLNAMLNNIEERGDTYWGKRAAQQQLVNQNYQKNLKEWNKAIGQLINTQEIFLDVNDKNGKKIKDLKFKLKVTSNNTIDWIDLQNKIDKHTDNGIFNLIEFSKSLAHLYGRIKQFEGVNLSVNQIYDQMIKNLQNAPLSYEAAREYFLKYLKDKDNVWTRNHYTAEMYAKEMSSSAILSSTMKMLPGLNLSPSIPVGNEWTDFQTEKEAIIKSIVSHDIETQINSNPTNTEIESNNKESDTPGLTAYNGIPSSVDQNGYASNYSPNVIIAKPGGYTFNVNFGDVNLNGGQTNDMMAFKQDLVNVIHDALVEASNA